MIYSELNVMHLRDYHKRKIKIKRQQRCDGKRGRREGFLWLDFNQSREYEDNHYVYIISLTTSPKDEHLYYSDS